MLDTECTVCKAPATKYRALCYEYMIGNKMGPYIIGYCEEHYNKQYADRMENEWSWEWDEEKEKAKKKIFTDLIEDVDFGKILYGDEDSK